MQREGRGIFDFSCRHTVDQHVGDVVASAENVDSAGRWKSERPQEHGLGRSAPVRKGQYGPRACACSSLAAKSCTQAGLRLGSPRLFAC